MTAPIPRALQLCDLMLKAACEVYDDPADFQRVLFAWRECRAGLLRASEVMQRSGGVNERYG